MSHPISDPVYCTCDVCGEKKMCRKLTDPFYDEGISEDATESFWCVECYSRRKDDV